MTSPNRLEQRKQQTHQQLLDAAEAVFSQTGYINASILDITEAANVSKRTFYLHFPDKETVLMELALNHMQEAREKIELDMCEWESAPMRVRFFRVTRAILEFAHSHPALMQIAFAKGGSLKLNNLVREYLAASMERNVTDYLPECHVKGIFQPLLAQSKAGVIFQILSWWVQNDYSQTPDELAELVTRILYDGIGSIMEAEQTEEFEIYRR